MLRGVKSRGAFPNLPLIYWAIAACALPTYVLSAVLPDIAEKLNVPLSQGGLVYALGPLFGFVLLVTAAATVGRVGKELIFAAGLILLDAAVVGLTLVSSFPLFLVWGALMWGASVITQVMGYALLADRYPDTVVKYQNVAGVFWSAGALTAPLFAGYLAETGFGWRGAFAVVALFASGAIAYLLLLVARAGGDRRATVCRAAVFTGSVPNVPRVAPAIVWNLLHRRDFLLLTFGLLCYLGAEITVTGWVSSFLQEVQQVSSVVAGLGLSVFWLGMGTGRFVVARLFAQRWSPPRLLMLAMGSGSLAMLAASYAPNALLSLFLFCVTGLFFAGGFPTLAGFLTTLLPGASSQALSLYLGIGQLGAVIFPALAGVVAERFGFQVGLSLAALLAWGLVGVAYRFDSVLTRGRKQVGVAADEGKERLGLSPAGDRM